MNALKRDEESIYHEARKITDPTARAVHIEQACADDPVLRGRVERLLGISEEEASFLEASPCTVDLEVPEIAERPGSVIGPYTLREQIGEGGMGSVYVAEQSQPVRRQVALKIIKPGMDTKQVIARFEAERQALAVMDHPNIARVFDGGATASGRPYFVMELVRGIPITEYCDREKLSIPERLELFVLVCRAVQHAHQKGIIHRDLKPSNILVTVIDGVAVPKVIDFGVAKAAGAALTDRTIYTAFQQLIGTPLYMSPEQADLSGVDVDTRGDIYSLGVILYELLTSTTPFDSETFRTAAFDEMRRIIREDEPPKPSTRLGSLGASVTTVSSNRKADARHLNRTVRGELDWIVMKALEKDRNRRYETANDFASDVMRFLTDQPVTACPPSVGYRLRKFVRRNRKGLATTALATASGLAIAGVLGATYLRDVGRIRRITQDVRQALAGARTAIELGDLMLAGQRVSEARGLLGTDAASPRGLATDVNGIGREIEARLAESTRFDQFVKRAGDAQDKMSYGNDPGGEAVAEEALGLYGILSEREWLPHLESSYLSTDQKRQVRETAYITLVSLADYGVRWPKKAKDPKSVERSLDLLRRAQAFHESTRACYFVRAECRRQQGDTAAADEDEERFKSTAARTAWDYYLPGHTAGWRGDREEAIRSYRAALRLQPNHYNSLFFLGMRLATDKINRRPEAIAYFTGCIALRPDDSIAYRNRGVCYYNLGQLDDALADFRQVIRLGSRHPGDHSNLGIALMEQGKLDEAVAAHREALRLRPGYADAHLNLGSALKEQGKPDEAIACYREALRINPNYGCAHNNLGEVLREQGKLDEALACSKEAVRLEPSHADHHSNLGEVLRRQGKLDEALACHQEALRVQPDDADTHNKLAWLLANCDDAGIRDVPKAVAMARRAVELAPRKSAHWATLGAAQYRAGDWESAIEALKKSTELAHGGDGFSGFHLAMAHRKLGHDDEARAWFAKAAAWMEKNKPKDEEFLRLRAEAEALLGVGPQEARPSPESALGTEDSPG